MQRTPRTAKMNYEAEQAEAMEMYQLRTVEKWTYARIATHMGTTARRVQRLLHKYCPKLIEKDAALFRDVEIGKLDELEERLWSIIDEDHYTISNGQVVYTETGEAVPDIDPVFKAMDKIIKISERRSKLLGLDKPVRVEATVTTLDARDAELLEMINEGRAANG
jgi:hypothetical protein